LVNPARMMQVLNSKIPVIEALLGADGQGWSGLKKNFLLKPLESPVFDKMVNEGLCLSSRNCVVFNRTSLWMPCCQDYLNMPQLSCLASFGSHVLCGGV